MAFHVEIRRGAFHRARTFNLDETRLRRSVLEPWSRGLRLTLGEQDWDPRECSLRVIEGPELSSAELGMGQGWNRAERTGREATRELLGRVPAAPKTLATDPGAGTAPAVAVVAESLSAGRELLARLAGGGIRALDWASLRERLLAEGSAAAPSAVVLLLELTPPSGAWLFDAGLAVGAVGPRAVVARPAGAQVPPELLGVAVIDVVPEPAAAAAALLDGLAAATAGIRQAS